MIYYMEQVGFLNYWAMQLVLELLKIIIKVISYSTNLSFKLPAKQYLMAENSFIKKGRKK